ncbi:MAG: hypothetical protein CM15mP128_0880 [Methanobacteriota archaeon]|nr:MAG: hypothetical protein CM15mP128_0880 [Euryarchaeota archaeon]
MSLESLAKDITAAAQAEADELAASAQSEADTMRSKRKPRRSPSVLRLPLAPLVTPSKSVVKSWPVRVKPTRGTC